MEANAFVEKIKAKSDYDQYDLRVIFDEYKQLLGRLSQNVSASFSLNVLSVLCRNLTKVPKWKDNIDNKELLTMTIECVRQTRSLNEPDQEKILACIHYIHKHIVKVNTSLPPELVLKLSFMPFEHEGDNIISTYYKTYWNILDDRLSYIGKLKTLKVPILKLLPKFTDDILRLIKACDAIEFCKMLLLFLIKKLFLVYNESTTELNEVYGKIFDCISKKDLKGFKTLMYDDALDIYAKLNDVLCIIAENSLRNNFKDSVFDDVTRTCILPLKYRPDMFHCFQTFYLNSFCCIFKDKTNESLDNVLRSLILSCDCSEKLRYKDAMNCSYPRISQILRLYLENMINNQKEFKKCFNETVQESCLTLILVLVQKLENCNQIVKCENCKVNSGLHDAMRLSFVIKHFITLSTNNGIDVKSYLPIYYNLVERQHLILNKLKKLRCSNYEKCFGKLQTDIHNTAITLNKFQLPESSIKLFEIYIANDSDLKNISRALFNKSICELSIKLYHQSLQNAFLSLILSLPEGLNSEKYMSLVMDIKVKSMKDAPDDDIQMMSVLEVCKSYRGRFMEFLSEIKFRNMAFRRASRAHLTPPMLREMEKAVTEIVFGGRKNFTLKLVYPNFWSLCYLFEVLKHELTMYFNLWPSIAPIVGVCKSLYDLTTNKDIWMQYEDEDTVLWVLYEAILEVPTHVRAIHNDVYKNLVNRLLLKLDKQMVNSVQEKMVYATLLFLKAEFNIAEASEKHGWKNKDVTDFEHIRITRNVEQEHNALESAFDAVHVLTEILPKLKLEKASKALECSLQIWQVSVQQLMYMQRLVYGLQLALICCEVAEVCSDKEAYLANASVLINYTSREFGYLVKRGSEYSSELVNDPVTMDTALSFMCDVAIYYIKNGKTAASAKIVQYVQSKIMITQQKQPDVNLQLALGRLMIAQYMLSPHSALSTLSSLYGLQRHYLSITSSSTCWTKRSRYTLTIYNNTTSTTITTTRVCRQLRLLRRAVTAARPLTLLSAMSISRIYCELINTNADYAQVKIDHRLKYVIGIKQTTDTQTYTQKQLLSTPKTTNIEPMRDVMFKSAQLSPSLLSLSDTIFKIPEFLTHDSCTCYSCDPTCVILTCHTCYLESSTFFRLKDFGIAKNYFTGTTQTFEQAEGRLKNIFSDYKKKFNSAIVRVLENHFESYFKQVQIEFLTELAFFELSQHDYKHADEHIIRIQELMTDDVYIKADTHNLIITSSKVRDVKAKPVETGLETEMETLKLSPNVNIKTPESKAMPKMSNITVTDEELPKKRKVIKLNFDEVIAEEEEKPKFKIPEPVTVKPVLENVTPRIRSRPDIKVQKPSVDEELFFTPTAEDRSVFFTPREAPMTSLKTYSRSIVKKLDAEFCTPKEVKKKESVKRSLKKATSPGKVENETPVTRSRRIRQPVLKN